MKAMTPDHLTIPPDATKPGNCYENAALTLLDNDDLGAVLVHGICVGRGAIEGVVHGHAWVECEGFVWDPSYQIAAMPRDLYYALGQIEYAVVYGRAQMVDNLRRLRTFGPWDEKIAATVHTNKSARRPAKRRTKK